MFCRSITSYFLNFITENIQVTEGLKYFPRRAHAAPGRMLVSPALKDVSCTPLPPFLRVLCNECRDTCVHNHMCITTVIMT